MNGYSKMRVVGSTKSRSIDFSDLFSPQIPKLIIKNTNPNPISKTQDTKETNNIKNINTHDPSLEQENEDVDGERFGVILNRNPSVSSTSSQRFGGAAAAATEKQQTTATLQSAVKRAFSMRRSSSVSEGYSRIHDQCDPLSSPTDDDGLTTMQTRSKMKKKKGGKILKVCKRLFGL